MNKKPFRLRVAEHYLKTGQKFSYLDIANDFKMSHKVASSCFAGIAVVSKYVTHIDRSATPYEMQVLDIRGKIEYTKPMKKREPKKPKTDELAKLRAQFCGLRG